MRVLGIDPGLGCTGYAVLEPGPKLLEAGVVRPEGGRDLARRLVSLAESLNEILDQWQPQALAVEQLYAHYDHPRTAILMGHARGVYFLLGGQRGIPVVSYPSTNVKKTVTGSGRASKPQMQLAVARELGLAQPPEPHDVADAIAVGLVPPACGKTAGMITRLAGKLTRVLDEEVRVEVGPLEYQVLVPEMVRRQIQLNAGSEIRLFISHYFESVANGARFIPRLIGFLHESELEFFELFCTVEKIGVKKALKALARPVKEIADAISRQDAKWLATLPGIGAATSEQIVTTLKRKVTKFALAATAGEGTLATGPQAQLVEDLYAALMGLGMTPLDARARLDQLLQSGKPFDTFDDAMKLIFTR